MLPGLLTILFLPCGDDVMMSLLLTMGYLKPKLCPLSLPLLFSPIVLHDPLSSLPEEHPYPLLSCLC